MDPTLSRPRRNRKNEIIRSLIRETHLGAEHLVYPLFIHEGGENEAIDSMPGCVRWTLGDEGVLSEVSRARDLGIRSFAFFPKVDDSLKSMRGEEAWRREGLVPRAVRLLKGTFQDITVITDVALDPYSSDGHDGIVGSDGRILNDETVEVLCRQALCHAAAGADMVAPSDMMDGRIGAIRKALDGEGYQDVSILSYTAKYASSFYGPFRGALDSAPKNGDKKTYQMDPANSREALRELSLDESEGADIVMVKPAGPYLDVIRMVRDSTHLPVAAYQVSGEYLMIRSAAKAGWIDEKSAILESLMCIRRAGADIIFTYFAKEAALCLSS